MNDSPENLYRTGVNYTRNKNHTLAFQFYQIAAEQGYAAAQNYLGRCYDSGFGTSVDHLLAVYWYQRAAEQGYTSALHNLGCMHHYRHGVSQDYVTAATYFRRAVIQGSVNTIAHLKAMAEKTNDFTVHYYLAISEKNQKYLQTLIKQKPQKILKTLLSTFPQNLIDNKTRFYFLKQLMIQETRPFLLRLFLNKSSKRDPDVGMQIAEHQYAYLSQLLKEGHNKKEVEETLNLLLKLLNTIPKNHDRYAEAEFIISHVKFMQNDTTWKTNFNNCRKHDTDGKLVNLEGITERIRKNVLNTYKDANRTERKEQRKTELKKIGENKYDLQALFRLSLMSSKRRANCEATIRALNPDSSFLQPQFI